MFPRSLVQDFMIVILVAKLAHSFGTVLQDRLNAGREGGTTVESRGAVTEQWEGSTTDRVGGIAGLE